MKVLRLVACVIAMALAGEANAGNIAYASGEQATGSGERTTGGTGLVRIFVMGDQLTKWCRAYKRLIAGGRKTANPQLAYDAAMCQGAVEMASDTDQINGNNKPGLPAHCEPTDTNGNDMIGVVANYLDAHPEKRTLAGYTLVRMALAEAWPCKN
jgi:Rap1a immunity proteins